MQKKKVVLPHFTEFRYFKEYFADYKKGLFFLAGAATTQKLLSGGGSRQKVSSTLFGVNYLLAGELFAQAPVSEYPGCVVEAVTDSSRYFVIRIEDGNGKILSLQQILCNHPNNNILLCVELFSVETFHAGNSASNDRFTYP